MPFDVSLGVKNELQDPDQQTDDDEMPQIISDDLGLPPDYNSQAAVNLPPSTYVTAVFSYKPQSADEIELRTGQKIKLLSSDSRHSGAEGWWVGQVPNTGYVGVFPSSYVENVSDSKQNLQDANIDQLVEVSTNSSCINPSELPIQPISLCQTVAEEKPLYDENIHNVTESCSFPEKLLDPSIDTTDSNVILRHESKVRTIPSSEIVQQQFIGAGSFGTVYRGLWRSKDVALKVFNLPTTQLDNEASHLCRLLHRNVVKFHGICQLVTNSLPALVMEFAYGGSLNTILSQHPVLGPVILLDWAIQIANGMSYLHSEVKLCHRDLKSSNILIREPIKKPYSVTELQGCTLLITDFGMACRFSQLAPQPSKLGTVAYAAPEVCRQDGFTFKSDIWSYGVVLWELLTLDIPFRSMEHPRLLFIIAMYNYTLHIPDGVPDLFVQLLTDCWAPEPLNRPTFENIITRLESCKNCSFLELGPMELAQIQQGWRDLIKSHHEEEQQSAAAALPSSIRSGSIEFTDEFLTQLDTLRNYRESLDRIKAELSEKAHELRMKEEHYNRIAGTIGRQFILLAVLAANQLKDTKCSVQTLNPKPPPPRKRPFVRSLFKRWISGGNPGPTNQNNDNLSINANTMKDRKGSVGSSHTLSARSGLDAAKNLQELSSAKSFDSVASSSRKHSGRFGCSQGGFPLISPPSDMKHVVHVDPEWLTVQGLCESTMRLFPSAFLSDSQSNANYPVPDLLFGSVPSGNKGNKLKSTTLIGTKSDGNVASSKRITKKNYKTQDSGISCKPSGNVNVSIPNTNKNQIRNHIPFQKNKTSKKHCLSTHYNSNVNADELVKNTNDFFSFLDNPNECETIQKCYHSTVLNDQSKNCSANDHCYQTGKSSHHNDPQISQQNEVKYVRIPIDSPSTERRRSASGPILSCNSEYRKEASLPSCYNTLDSVFESNRPNQRHNLFDLICDPSLIPYTPNKEHIHTDAPVIHNESSHMNTSSDGSNCSDSKSESSLPIRSSCSTNSKSYPLLESILLTTFRLAASFCFLGLESSSDQYIQDLGEENAYLPNADYNFTNQNGSKCSNSILNQSTATTTTSLISAPDLLRIPNYSNNNNFRYFSFKKTMDRVHDVKTSLPKYLSQTNCELPLSMHETMNLPNADAQFSSLNVQDGRRRIQSADRRGNFRTNHLSNSLNHANIYDKNQIYVDHQVEFGDPHSPFLGMLAGSGRRPNSNQVLDSYLYPDYDTTSRILFNKKTLSSDRLSTKLQTTSNDNSYAGYLMNVNKNLSEFNSTSRVYNENINNTSLLSSRLNLPNQSYWCLSANCNQCSKNALDYDSNSCHNDYNHNSDKKLHFKICSNSCCDQNLQLNESNLFSHSPPKNRIKTPLIMDRQPDMIWSGINNWPKQPHEINSNNEYIDLSSASSLSSSTKSVDKRSNNVPLFLDQQTKQIQDTSLSRKGSTDKYSSISVTMNPVGVSRDAYLKATQDGYLNRVAYDPSSVSVLNHPYPPLNTTCNFLCSHSSHFYHNCHYPHHNSYEDNKLNNFRYPSQFSERHHTHHQLVSSSSYTCPNYLTRVSFTGNSAHHDEVHVSNDDEYDVNDNKINELDNNNNNNVSNNHNLSHLYWNQYDDLFSPSKFIHSNQRNIHSHYYNSGSKEVFSHSTTSHDYQDNDDEPANLPDEDLITLIPIESYETYFTNHQYDGTNEKNEHDDPSQFFMPTENEEKLLNTGQTLLQDSNTTVPKTVLHRSQALRERHRPPFLALFRNHSDPYAVEKNLSCDSSKEEAKVITVVTTTNNSLPSLISHYPGDNTDTSLNPSRSQSSSSPCGPFVSVHSTLL